MSEAVAIEASSEALVDRVVTSTIGLFELAGLYLGDRLGLYRALHDKGRALPAGSWLSAPARTSATCASGSSTRP